ncbi:MAG TPA: BON domain-containing protein [Candidatus Baltobacteraceae bacterium]
MANPVDDIDLAAAIAAALQDSLRCGITVHVSHGKVTLEGEADTDQQRARAESIAYRFCSNVTSAVRLKAC